MEGASLVVAIFGLIIVSFLATIVGSLKVMVVELQRINRRLEGRESKAES